MVVDNIRTVIVGSTNPVKVQATRNGFERMFPGGRFRVQSVSTPSGVSVQPMSDEETYRGAANRAAAARVQVPDADFWVGIEGGVVDTGDEMRAFAWIIIESRDCTGKSRTATFELPYQVVELVREGKELGEADDLVFGRSNSKQENGSVGLLTDDVMDRTEFYEHAVVLALIPVKNPALAFGMVER